MKAVTLGRMRPAALVLAAGRSSRMGSPKALLALDGRSFLAWIAATLAAGGVRDVVVVTAPDGAAIAAEGARLGARIVINPDPARGMLSSVTTGLVALGEADP